MIKRRQYEEKDKLILSGNRPAIIVDMDGTLAHMNGRSPFDDKRSHQDMPNSPVIATINGMRIAYPELKIIIVSGRHEESRQATVEFLQDYSIQFDALFMREDGDYRGDDIVKEEIYYNNIKPEYDVFYVVDDRSRVIKKWRSLNLTVFQVAEGDF